MNDIKSLREAGQGLAQNVVDGLRALAAAHRQQDGPLAAKAGEGEALGGSARKECGAYGRARINAFATHVLQGILKGDANGIGKAGGDPIRQARGIIRFVGDDGRLVPGGDGHRHGYIPALGEDHIRLYLFDNAPGLKEALYHAEGIREILKGKIAAQLARTDGVVGHARFFG